MKRLRCGVMSILMHMIIRYIMIMIYLMFGGNIMYGEDYLIVYSVLEIEIMKVIVLEEKENE